MILDEAKHAVITVGAGRGFVVESKRGRLVVTAAHCLPRFPRRASVSHSAERTYNALLGPLGKEPSVSTECLFADPISDIAVLGGPDSQQLPEQAEHYDALMAMVTALPISDTPKRAAGWLLSLDGRWNRCEVRHNDGPLWLFHVREGIVSGMSGSPILSEDRAAIGVVCAGGGTPGETHTDGGPNARLVYNLPTWVLK